MKNSTEQKKREEIELLHKDVFAFLAEKPLFYKKIDYERMPRIFSRIKKHFSIPKVIHIVGTNAKGTTGRFLAAGLHQAGFRVGHYTSPHIMRFNERIWIDGDNISDAVLQQEHEKLLDILEKKEAESLSYFEYTTLLAMLCFAACDYVVLEAGLGGEHDATAVFEKTLTILTPVGLDHQEFLGTTIEEIAATKLGSAADMILIAKQPYEAVVTVAKRIAKQKKALLYRTEKLLNASELQHARRVAENKHFADYLLENLQTAIAALKLLGISLENYDFAKTPLFGRLTPIANNVLLDVGHNALAAQAIQKALFPKRYVLIYNSFKDKEYRSILSILKPIIKWVEIIDISDARRVDRQKLQKTLNELRIQYSSFNQIQHGEHYLVFGSFSVAEEFLKRFYA